MKKQNIFSVSLSVLVSTFLVSVVVFAASTVGTNLSTTGTLSVTGTGASFSTNIETTGYASVSGNLNFGGSGAHTIAALSGSGALTINAFTLGGAITAGGNNIVNTKHFGINNSGAVNPFYLSDSSLNASTATASFTIVANGVTASSIASISATALTSGNIFNIRLPNASFVGGILNAVRDNGAVVASISGVGNLELAGYASASRVILGGVAASSSTAYVAEFKSAATAASTSVLFSGGGTSLGTCLQMKDTKGRNLYVRFNGGTNLASISATYISCR